MRKLPSILLLQVGRLDSLASALQNLLEIPLATHIISRRIFPLMKAVFLDIDAALQCSKHPTQNLLGVVAVVAIAVVIAALHVIRFLSTLLSRLFVLL